MNKVDVNINSMNSSLQTFSLQLDLFRKGKIDLDFLIKFFNLSFSNIKISLDYLKEIGVQ